MSFIATIKSKKEFEQFYYYTGSKPKVYPKEYPCVCMRKTCGGGIVGEYISHFVNYFPKVKTIEEAFIKGLERGSESNGHWEFLC